MHFKFIVDSKLNEFLSSSRILQAMKDISQFYQDPYNFAALASSYDDCGEILFVSDSNTRFAIKRLIAQCLGIIMDKFK